MVLADVIFFDAGLFVEEGYREFLVADVNLYNKFLPHTSIPNEVLMPAVVNEKCITGGISNNLITDAGNKSEPEAEPQNSQTSGSGVFTRHNDDGGPSNNGKEVQR